MGFLQAVIITAFSVIIAPHLTLTVNITICFFFFILGHISFYFFLYLKEANNFFVKFISNILYFLLPNLENFNITSLIAQGDPNLENFNTISNVIYPSPVSTVYILYSILYCLLYTIFLLYIGVIFFNKKEIKKNKKIIFRNHLRSKGYKIFFL